MMALLERIESAIWRSSWQAAVLAIVIFIVLRLFGGRLTPRWRFLLLSVVLARFLFIAAPATSWSMFNLIPWHDTVIAERSFDPTEEDTANSERQSRLARRKLPNESAERKHEQPSVAASAQRSSAKTVNDTGMPVASSNTDAVSVDEWTISAIMRRCLTGVWLIGCILSSLHLLASASVLRRRLSTCRRVTDPAVLHMLEAIGQRVGIKHMPTLLVSPELISPCVLATWNPRLIVPESIVTDSPASCLRHVLAHELGHLRRGDLWTNWLLLVTRILHWFNPVAWWTVRELQAEREAACDELALAALGESERTAYAHTIIDLTASLLPSALVPGMIGLFTSARRVKYRVERLVQPSRVATIHAPLAAGLMLGFGLIGLTDAMPPSANRTIANVDSGAATPNLAPPNRSAPTNDYVVRGRCIDHTDKTPLAGMNIVLFKAEGRTTSPVKVAETTTNARGQFEFTGLIPPRPGDRLDSLTYAAFAHGGDRPYGVQFFTSARTTDLKPEEMEIRMSRDKAIVTGRVVNEQGQPVAGATVMQRFFTQGAVPGILSATTDASGRFTINDVPIWRFSGQTMDITLTAVHPDYPETIVQSVKLPADVVLKLPTGCIVTGTVTDGVTGQPAADSVVTLQKIARADQAIAATDGKGNFRVAVNEGRYNVTVESKDRVCLAKIDQECRAGETVNLPNLTLIDGGFIAGQVVNTATGQPVATSESNEPISIGLYGPSQPQPQGGMIRPYSLASVDGMGRFKMRAAAGENFPYFINTHGDRMGWDTLKQPPVIVQDGQTTSYNMLITPPIPPSEKLNAARTVIASLSHQPFERTEQILVEFRKLSHTVDETELWCMLMRELVTIGPAAVPRLCDELDHTTEDRTQRRIAFALRAIGDARAVPALIRSIPKTLQPSSSDYGLIVEDGELTAFMRKHDLSKSTRGQYFDLGRPDREVFGALQTLTRQDFQDEELSGMFLSDDPRRAVLQGRIFTRHAEHWASWWEANWKTLTNDAAYQKVSLRAGDEALPPPPDPSNLKARLGEGAQGEILSPAVENGRHAAHFLDLDTGFQPQWPAQFANDETKVDQKQLADWAAKNGIDLMCVTHSSSDGKNSYVLRGFDLKAWEISQRDLRNIDKLLASNKVPQGPEVGELLMHYDASTKQFVPEANAAFLFVTREGNLGLIEITDRVTRTANLTGYAAEPPQGVGFFKGVRFNWKPIIPSN